MSNLVNFPPEIIEEILYRLPAKSIGRFKCVSKSWLSLISKPEFTITHFNRNRSYQKCKIILLSNYRSLYSIDLDDDEPFINNKVVLKELSFQPQMWLFEIHGSCNGLVLGSDQFMTSLFLVNPTTHVFKKLPRLRLALKPRKDVTMLYGLGYDSCTDDYKVVTISFYSYGSLPDSSVMNVHVYTLKTNTWRMLEDSPYDHAVGYQCDFPGIYLNGSLHWLAKRVSYNPLVIVAFGVTSETFGTEVPLPYELDDNNRIAYGYEKLGVLGGCLCISYFSNRKETHVWIMKEYGVKESWVKNFVFGPELSRVDPICLKGDREVLLGNEKDEVLLYNVEERRLRRITVTRIPTTFRIAGTYIESLLSPNSHFTMGYDH